MGAKRALLVVASAALFHARLGEHFGTIRPESLEGKWPPQTLGECMVSDDGVREALTESWCMIMDVDYRQIFRTAIKILAVGGSSRQFADAIAGMVKGLTARRNIRRACGTTISGRTARRWRRGARPRYSGTRMSTTATAASVFASRSC